ncbi:MAG: ammonium transporter, Amt family [Actinomycetota bacterium]|nr:ammonium transporter, Amt family [Actinomycetota bacterium]
MDTGDTAWVLLCSALVLFMTPGLALFYGGMVRSKNVLGTLMHSFFAMGLISILWVLIGYTLAFGPDHGGLIGGLDFLGFHGVSSNAPHPAGLGATIPHSSFAIFQMMFAIITPALITGAFAERIKFSGYIVFMSLWLLLVYAPVAHWVWHPDGWLFKLGALDFAGGTVVHINAGIAALVAVIVVGKRRGFGKEAFVPHNLTLTILGTGILWFGWFGFNAGSALGANGLAASAFLATNLGAAAGAVGWALMESMKDRKATTLGVASGAVAGLVAITPASGYVGPLGAIAIGLLGGVICSWAVSLKFRFGYDDSLDVVGVHMVGGLVGALATGIFSTAAINEFGADGLLAGGGLALLGKQAVAVGATLAFSFIVTMIICKVVDATVGLRVTEEDEITGLDLSQHSEVGYSLSESSGSSMSHAGSHAEGHMVSAVRVPQGGEA